MRDLFAFERELKTINYALADWSLLGRLPAVSSATL
jgi:hypothetical protein